MRQQTKVMGSAGCLLRAKEKPDEIEQKKQKCVDGKDYLCGLARQAKSQVNGDAVCVSLMPCLRKCTLDPLRCLRL